MDSIDDLFKSEANNLRETFNCHNGQAGFRIPIYQRSYTWDSSNIFRLFEDVFAGIHSLTRQNDPVTFLGTLIVTDERNRKEDSFQGTSLSVVDGQQRLTTLSLIISRLLLQCHYCKLELDISDGPLKDWLIAEVEFIKDELFDCVIGRPSARRQRSFYDNFPRVVREPRDVRARDEATATYESLISSYIFSIGQYIDGENPPPVFSYVPTTRGDEWDLFKQRLDWIEEYVLRFEEKSSELGADAPDAKMMMEQSNFRKCLFSEIGKFDSEMRRLLEQLRSTSSEPMNRLIRTLALSNYFLYNVALTRVEAEDDKYAFDIFEALNTTGEPLTAIETFRPLVVQFETEEGGRGYVGSDSEAIFENIEAHMAQYKTNDQKNKEARASIIQLALYADARKLGGGLSDQRSFLRTHFNRSTTTAQAKRDFVKCFGEIIDYRRRFWNKTQLSNELRSAADKEMALFCLAFVRDLNNSLTVPVLTRYLVEAESQNNPALFVEAVKAVTAFLVLRRGATGGTQGIDDDYRKLMSHGHAEGSDSRGPLKVGDSGVRNAVPDIATFREYLRSYLEKMSSDFTDRTNWLQYFTQQPIYKSTGYNLCKFYLLCAEHYSRPDPETPGLIRRERNNRETDCLNLSTWESDEFGSIEHIAPDNPGQGWESDIYENLTLKHSIGNLSLLPKDANAAIGNKPWATKRLFYRACAARTDEELQLALQDAQAAGMDFGPRTTTMLQNHQCLSTVSNVAEVDTWNKEIIERRSQNIGELVWEVVAPWIGLPTSDI